MKKVIVFAGTNEGRKLSTFLAENGVEVTGCSHRIRFTGDA